MASTTVKTQQAICSDKHYDAFWDLVLKAKQDIDVDDPKHAMEEKSLQKLDEDCAPADFPTDCQIYFEALDLAISTIQDPT